MKTMEVRYNDNDYILKEVEIHGTDVWVGNTDLESELIRDGEYTSAAAKNIDEMIYFYVDPKEFRAEPHILQMICNMECD